MIIHPTDFDSPEELQTEEPQSWSFEIIVITFITLFIASAVAGVWVG